jgi:hypothetical protein
VFVHCYCFSDQYNTINDLTFIYSLHTLRQVSVSSYGHIQAVLQIIYKEKLPQPLSLFALPVALADEGSNCQMKMYLV